MFNHRPEDAGEFVGGSGDSGLRSKLGLDSAEPIAESGLGAVQRLGGHAQGGGETILDFARMRGMCAPSGDTVIRAQAHPRGEVLGTGKLVDVGAHFAQKCQAGLDADAFDCGQIDTELIAKLLAQWFVMRLFGFAFRSGHRFDGPIFQFGHQAGDLLIAVGHQALVETPGLE